MFKKANKLIKLLQKGKLSEKTLTALQDKYGINVSSLRSGGSMSPYEVREAKAILRSSKGGDSLIQLPGEIDVYTGKVIPRGKTVNNFVGHPYLDSTGAFGGRRSLPYYVTSDTDLPRISKDAPRLIFEGAKSISRLRSRDTALPNDVKADILSHFMKQVRAGELGNSANTRFRTPSLPNASPDTWNLSYIYKASPGEIVDYFSKMAEPHAKLHVKHPAASSLAAGAHELGHDILARKLGLHTGTLGTYRPDTELRKVMLSAYRGLRRRNLDPSDFNFSIRHPASQYFNEGMASGLGSINKEFPSWARALRYQQGGGLLQTATFDNGVKGFAENPELSVGTLQRAYDRIGNSVLNQMTNHYPAWFRHGWHK